MEAFFVKYWPVAVVALQALALWAMWSMRQVSAEAVRLANEKSEARDKALDDRIDGEATKITELRGRVENLQGEIDDLPTKADLARVEGLVHVVDAKMETANRGIGRLEGYFLNKGVGVPG